MTDQWNIEDLRSMIKGCQYKMSDESLTDKEFERWFKYMRELVTAYNRMTRMRNQIIAELGI